MRVFAVPGRHPNNGPWMEKVLSGLHLDDAEVINHSYLFWQNSEPEVDEHAEVARIAAFMPDLIIAKSLGTIITAFGIQQQKLQPSKLVLIGLPLKALREGEAKWFQDLAERNISVLFIQQTQDPGGSFSEIRSLFEKEGHTFVEVPGDDHLYSEVNLLADAINSWL